MRTMELHISPLVSTTLHVRDTCIYIVNRYDTGAPQACIYTYTQTYGLIVIHPPPPPKLAIPNFGAAIFRYRPSPLRSQKLERKRRPEQSSGLLLFWTLINQLSTATLLKARYVTYVHMYRKSVWIYIRWGEIERIYVLGNMRHVGLQYTLTYAHVYACLLCTNLSNNTLFGMGQFI